jgi:hypothetical protein
MTCAYEKRTESNTHHTSKKKLHIQLLNKPSISIVVFQVFSIQLTKIEFPPLRNGILYFFTSLKQ